jgi:hypothetical protein
MYPTFFHVCGIRSDAFSVTVSLGFLVALLVVRAELSRQGHDGGAAAPLRAVQGG